MATLNITVPNSAIPRIQNALKVTTATQVESLVQQWLKERVAIAESVVAGDTTRINVTNEDWNV